MHYDHNLDFFGFSSIPFQTQLKKPFIDEKRHTIINTLNNFLSYRGFAVLYGAPGTGKTMILKYLCSQLNPNENKIIYIPFAMLKPADILKNICLKLDLEPTISSGKMLQRIQNCAMDIQPVNPIIIIDEIQKISHESLEILRVMTNINFEEKNIFSVIMAGSEEFIQKLKLRINHPLKQRVTCFLKIYNLSREDTEQYIRYNIKQAGVQQDIISKEALNLAYDISAGIPRVINNIMIHAIQIAAQQQSKIIDFNHIQQAHKIIDFQE